MQPKSLNGYAFSTSGSADGTEITIVAAKDDHEGKETHVFRLDTTNTSELWQLIKNQAATANERRKATRRAAVAARPSAHVGGEGKP